MSVHLIYYENGRKMMRPVKSPEEYLALRDSEQNRRAEKKHMVQMNYSCLPTPPQPEDPTWDGCGPLKGANTPSTSVGMDIDFDPQDPDYEQKMQQVPDLIMAKKDELGLLMLERSATKGYHIVFTRNEELSQEENLRWASDLLGVAYDQGAKDITRVFYTPADKLIFLDEELFRLSPALQGPSPRTLPLYGEGEVDSSCKTDNLPRTCVGILASDTDQCPLPIKGEGQGRGSIGSRGDCPEEASYLSFPYSQIIAKWWELYNYGAEPVKSNRNTLTFELAVNLRHICGFDRALLDRVIPCYDGFDPKEKLACIDSALSEKRTQMPKRLKDVLTLLKHEQQQRARQEQAPVNVQATDDVDLDDDEGDDSLRKLGRLPLGIRDSVEAVGPQMALPVITAICPAIGALASGVELAVHRKMRHLNLISYIAGDYASGKGDIDPVVAEWMQEVKAMDKMYLQQETDWRVRKRAAKNKKEQPEEPKLPIRCLTLNNTVANLAERLANTEGRHAFSYTPEADTVAQKWKSSMCDFSVMLRQAYDNSSFEREARSVDAVNVHIDKLLWNVTMCGTPDALYRVVYNYTDGFQSRIAVARTPDNTFAPLPENPNVMTTLHAEHIRQVAHLLPLMNGRVSLPKLEAQGRAWVEGVRNESSKNFDAVRARQRMRVCVTAQRMTCCLMLCRVCEVLIQKHGLSGAEQQLKAHPNLWRELLLKAQTPQLLKAYDVIANMLIDNAMFFFRRRIEAAFNSRDYAGSGEAERCRAGKNDSIFERLDVEFTFDQALQQTVAMKGADVTRNQVQQMLKNWRKQGLIVPIAGNRFRKTFH